MWKIDFTSLSLVEIIGAVIIVYLLTKTIIEASSKVYKWFLFLYNKKKGKEEFVNTVDSQTIRIDEMDKRHKQDYEILNQKIDRLSESFEYFVDETKKDTQVTLRGKIYETYKETLQKNYILENEYKNYHYALKRYKANDGNSYIIDEIEPKMKEFKRFITDEEAEEYFKEKNR